MPVGVSAPSYVLTSLLLLLASVLLDPAALLLERGRRTEPLDAAVLAREVVGLLLPDRSSADRAAERPGLLERLQALHADEARAHAVDVARLERHHDVAVDAAVGQPDPLRGMLLELERDHRLAPALSQRSPPRRAGSRRSPRSAPASPRAPRAPRAGSVPPARR